MTKTEQYIQAQNGLVTYIKVSSGKHRGNRRGVVVALPTGDGVKFGWSFTNFKAGDIFDKERGLEIAVARTVKPNRKALTPHEVSKTIARLEERSKRYFKQFSAVAV
jgi:hypothetical protein